MSLFLIIPALPREMNWIVTICLLLGFGLFFFTLYLIARACITKTQNLPVAPIHIQMAQSILKWIAVIVPLLSLFGGLVDKYHQIIKICIKGEFDDITPYILINEFALFLALGVFVSLVALFGIALIFIKRLWHQKQQKGQT
jgi:hypothetical protein